MPRIQVGRQVQRGEGKDEELDTTETHIRGTTRVKGERNCFIEDFVLHETFHDGCHLLRAIF